MSDPVIIGDATLYLGDCRKSKIKSRVGCRSCEWVWKPSGEATREACPNCGIVRDVRDRNGEKKPNIESIKKW